jgi:hypothetical protein
MRLSYTNPITGHRVSRDAGVRYLQIDGVVLEVRHYYRSRDAWSIHAYRDHFSTDVALDWVRSGKDIVIADVRRKGLLDQLARYINSDEWATKRQSWLNLTAQAQR